MKTFSFGLLNEKIQTAQRNIVMDGLVRAILLAIIDVPICIARLNEDTTCQSLCRFPNCKEKTLERYCLLPLFPIEIRKCLADAC